MNNWGIQGMNPDLFYALSLPAKEC